MEKKEKGFDFSEAISPEIIETPPNYDYGRNQEALDYNLLRNKPNQLGLFKIVTATILWWVTWNISIIWSWFLPKYVRIQAQDWVYLSTWDWWTDWVISSWIKIRQKYPSSDWIHLEKVNRLIDLEYIDASSQTIRATFVSFDSNWITINVWTNTYGSTTQLIVTFMW